MSLRAERSVAKQSTDIKQLKDCFGKKRLAMTATKCSIYDRLQYYLQQLNSFFYLQHISGLLTMIIEFQFCGLSFKRCLTILSH